MLGSWICKINFICITQEECHLIMCLKGYPEHTPLGVSRGRMRVGKLRAQMVERA